MAIRLIIVFIAHLLIVEAVCQLSVNFERESTDELVSITFNFLLLAGLLIWAVLPGFKKINNIILRILARTGIVIMMFFAVQTADYFYYWHLRPNLGLYKEPAWVSKYPSFQQKTRERIKLNTWSKSAESEGSKD